MPAGSDFPSSVCITKNTFEYSRSSSNSFITCTLTIYTFGKVIDKYTRNFLNITNPSKIFGDLVRRCYSIDYLVLINFHLTFLLYRNVLKSILF